MIDRMIDRQRSKTLLRGYFYLFADTTPEAQAAPLRIETSVQTFF